MRQRPVILVGAGLIALGIGGLVWSYLLASGGGPDDAWLAGTLQALGVGFVVGGIVDVVVISRLDAFSRSADRKRSALNNIIKDSLEHDLITVDGAARLLQFKNELDLDTITALNRLIGRSQTDLN